MEQGGDQYKRVKYQDGKYQLVSEPIPNPGQGQLLIKVAYSTCNPYDGYLYSTSKTAELGSDGCGVIVKVGEGVDDALVGKKVSFFDGGWAQYRLIDLNGNVFFLDDSQDLSKAASASVNPMTALGQLDIVRQKGAKAVIAMAAASGLNKIFIQLLNREGVEIINIVRRDEHVKLLKDQYNAKFALNSSSPTFQDDLKALIDQLHPTLIFDYIGGEVPQKVFDAMPVGSEFITVANLTNSTIQVHTGALMFTQKVIRGFVVYFWLASLTAAQKKEKFQPVADDLREGGKIFGTHNVKTVPLDDWEKTLGEFAAVASEGKILINCD